MMQRNRIATTLTILTLILAPLLQGCAMASSTAVVTIGAGESPEQQLLGELTALVLKEAGYNVRLKSDLGSPWMLRKAIVAGSVDLVWDYTGRVWLQELGHDQLLSDPAELYYRLRQEDALHGLTWIALTGVEDRSVVVVTETLASSQQMLSVSNLAHYLNHLNPDLVLCTTKQIESSAYGAAALQRVYGLRFKAANIRVMDPAEAITGLRDGTCHCALISASAVPARAADLRQLWDDRDLMPASNLAPVLRTYTLNNHPDLAAYLRRLCAALDRAALNDMLAEIAEGKRPARVVRQFLRANDVVSTPTPTFTPKPTPTGTPPAPPD